MNAESTMLFEKFVSLFLMVAILALIGLGTFYFKRRVIYLESAVKDQAQITQNILGMLNTMLKADEGIGGHAKQATGYEKPAFSPFSRQAHVATGAVRNTSSMQTAVSVGLGGGGGLDVTVIDLGAMLVPECARNREAGESPAPTIIEIEGVANTGTCGTEDEGGSSPPTTHPQPREAHEAWGRGRIVVSDSDGSGTDEERGESDIDSHEVAAAIEADAAAEGAAEADAPHEAHDNESKRADSTDGDIGLSITTNEAKSAYERLKVGELRDLLEKRGSSDAIGHKYKQMKKVELVAALHALDASPSSSLSPSLSPADPGFFTGTGAFGSVRLPSAPLAPEAAAPAQVAAVEPPPAGSPKPCYAGAALSPPAASVELEATVSATAT